MIYSTCTFNPEENKNNLAYWSQKLDFNSLEIPFPEHWKTCPVKKGEIFSYYFYPHRIKGESFFVSVLQKNVTTSPKMAFYKKGRIPLSPIDKTNSEKIHSWIRADTVDTLRLVRNRSSIYALD